MVTGLVISIVQCYTYNMPYKDKQKKKEYDRLYSQNHSEIKREASLRWYKENKALAVKRALIYSKKLKKENPKKWHTSLYKRHRKWAQSPKGIYVRIKSNSRKRKMDVGIERGDFINWYISKIKNCYYCGITGKMTIERKNNDLPYFLSNIELACDNCNKVKSNILTEQEMLIVGKLIMQKRWKNQ